MAKQNRPLNILCVTNALVGRPFIMEAHRLGHKIWMLMGDKNLKEAWPTELIEDMWAVEKIHKEEQFETIRKAISYKHRDIGFDRIVSFTDWTLEAVSRLREHLRIPGMGDTTGRYFRDKLAMRMKTQEDGIRVPEFVPLFNWKAIHEYIDRVPAPWVIKPRLMAASMGIKKINSREELWPEVDKLGDQMSFYLLEKYTPGDVYHVDSVVSEHKVELASCSLYGTPMLDLNTSGGVFTTRIVKRGSKDEKALKAINEQVIKSLGLLRGVTHIEYIKGKEDGKFYFLEAASRVGAARIPDVIFHATDICLWWEWAKIDTLEDHSAYKLPPARKGYAGIVATLAQQEEPDLSVYDDPEICFRQSRKHHAGLIVKSDSYERVEELLNDYAPRFIRDFTAHKPFEMPAR